MLKKWRNHHVLLLAALTAVSSTGFAETQDEPGEHTNFLPSKLLETLKSRGVTTLRLGPVWESAVSTQTFYSKALTLLLSSILLSFSALLHAGAPVWAFTPLTATADCASAYS